MSEMKERIRAVLEQHPLEAGTDFYAGTIVCTTCHRGFINPAHHLLQALTAALDPDYQTPTPQPSADKFDPRESQINPYKEGAA